MEQRLQEVLLDGEIVRWSGRPSPFKLMSIPSRTSLLLTWVLCSAALAVILGGLIPFFLRTHQAVTDLTVILMIAAFLPAMISIRPLLDKWSLEHDTIYAITNYRVLALVKNNLMYIPLGRILTHSIEARDGESGNLCFCEAVGQSSSKMLDNAILGVRCAVLPSPASPACCSSTSLSQNPCLDISPKRPEFSHFSLVRFFFSVW